MSIVRKCKQNIRCCCKSGIQMTAILPDQFPEIIRHFFCFFLSCHFKIKRQYIPSLKFLIQCPLSIHKSYPVGFFYFFRFFPVKITVCPLSKCLCNLTHDLTRIAIICGSCPWTFSKPVLWIPVRCTPITKLKRQ